MFSVCDINRVEKYKQGWRSGLPETECGSGSRIKDTEKQREWMPKIIRKYNIQTIADIGAGDLNWITKTDLSGAEYQGYDLVPRHGSVKQFDLVNEIPPAVDLIMCLWVLNHFPFDDCRAALKNLKASGAKYLMMTDRPDWHGTQPPEIQTKPLESIVILNEPEAHIKMIAL